MRRKTYVVSHDSRHCNIDRDLLSIVKTAGKIKVIEIFSSQPQTMMPYRISL